MNNKKMGTIIIIIVGILMVTLSLIYNEKFSFVLGGLGIALIGMSIEFYLKNKKDTTTENGENRNMIAMHDERTVFINAKSGETVNYIMDFCTVIAFILANLLNVSLAGRIIILSLILIRLVINPIVKSYYEKRG
jgi:membrane protein insertase Oxa1/YidC/SpoIIIJ